MLNYADGVGITMNSHQRRLSRRYWRYHETLEIRNLGQGLLLVEWCEEQFGPRSKYSGRWALRANITSQNKYVELWFHGSKDALLFALRWL